MNPIKLKKLELQVMRTIPFIESESTDNPSSMMELIQKRFIKALHILENSTKSEIKKEDFTIVGCSKAFLEVSTDYNHPLLIELGRTEEAFSEVFH